MSRLGSWGQAPKQYPCGRRRQYWDEPGADEAALEREALIHAKKVERFLLLRMAGCEKGGRDIPACMHENLAKMRARVAWIVGRLAELEAAHMGIVIDFVIRRQLAQVAAPSATHSQSIQN